MDFRFLAIGVLASIGHAHQAGLLMLELEVLILELLAVDRLAAGAVSICEVPALAHETWDDAVERGALVVQGHAALGAALLARAQGPEVLDGLGHLVAVEADDDAAGLLAVHRYVEEHLVRDGGVARDVLALHEVLPAYFYAYYYLEV